VLIDRSHRLYRDLGERSWNFGTLHATQLFLLSFGALILVGTLGFLLLPGLYEDQGLGFVDALFTATSAVCVTGLIVVDTATYFTPLGQAWIAVLIQLGGLGMLTFTTLVIGLLGRRSGLEATEAAAGHASAIAHLRPRELVRHVVIATFLLEAVGAIALWLLWIRDFGAADAVWPAVFHAISAFCNAGFSVFSNSLEGFADRPSVVGLVSVLIVLGGLGFIVLSDLWRRWRRPDVRRFSTHTRLVLASTGVLLAGATFLFLVFEVPNTFREMGWVDRFSNAWFMAVTPRTAGFNTVNYDTVSNPSLFLTILLMIVGGSPGSTAGGLKTTTLALLVLVFVQRLRGRDHVSVGGRTVPEGTVQRAAALTIGAIVILGVGVFVLSTVEHTIAHAADRADFLRLVFEVHSAFGTVGLSMGVTSSLGAGGRLILVVLMYLGRVGPLAVASAMVVAVGRQAARYRYAREDVVIG